MPTESMRGVLSFVKTVSSGSFVAAARELGITPVAVSKNVARLEQELGVRLLQRSTRKLGVTREGQLFYQRCADPLRELESARSAARERASAMTGVVRVTGVTPFTQIYLQPLIAAFAKIYPNVEVALDLDDNISDMIAQGYDVGIRAGRVEQATVVARRIATLPFVVCGSTDYLGRHPPLLTPPDLLVHNCLRFRHRASRRLLGWTLTRGGEEITPEVSGNFVSNDLTALITAALHGQGLVYAPLPRVLPLLRSGELKLVLPDWFWPGFEVSLHYPSRKGLPARVHAFIKFMLEHLRRHPDLQTDPQALLAPFRG